MTPTGFRAGCVSEEGPRIGAELIGPDQQQGPPLSNSSPRYPRYLRTSAEGTTHGAGAVHPWPKMCIPVSIATLFPGGGRAAQTRSRASCWPSSVASCAGYRWVSQKLVASARAVFCISESAFIVLRNNGGDGGTDWLNLGCNSTHWPHWFLTIPLATLAAQS